VAPPPPWSTLPGRDPAREIATAKSTPHEASGTEE